MIRPLRIRHRRIFTVLGVVLPVAFGLGIAARKPVPLMSAVPGNLQAASRAPGPLVWERADLFKKAPVQVRLLREGGRLAVACVATDDFAKPDLLVYWSQGDAPVTNHLPGNAVLLGAFSSSALPVPEAAERASGVLVLFSLADQEVVAISQPLRFNSSTL